MNATKETVKRIFGDDFPDGATSFHAVSNGIACFCIGKTGALVDVEMTSKQIEQMRKSGYIGSLGWALK